MKHLKSGSRVSLFALGAVLGCAPFAAADDATLYQDTIIVTDNASTLEAEALVAKTPGGADVVPHEDYADRFLVSLRDTLAFSPGVYTQPRFGQEVRISIRGSGLSRGYHMRGLTLLQDGVPINLADDNGDFQELEPIFFDHLEVFRGSNALRYGSGTLGGAINGVTPTGRTAPGVYVRADVGSNDTARLLVSGGMAGGRLDAWGAVSADTSDGDRDHAKRESVRFNGNVGYAVTDRITTRFYASVNQLNQELPGALTETVALNEPKTGNFTGDQGRDIESVRLQNQTTIAFDNSELKLGVFLNDKSLHHPIFQVIEQDTQDRGAFARWDWAGDRWEATIGGEARFGDVDYQRYINNDGASAALAFDADQKAYTRNVYSELRYHATDRLTLIGGGIYANGKREQFEKFNLFSGGATGVKGEKEFNAFSPKLGVLYAATPDIQVYGNLSKSAEFPGYGELAQVAAFVPVEKQTAWTLEAGTRGRKGIAEWDVSVYRSEIDGELLQYTVNADIPASTFNGDQTVHQGVEAGLSLQLNDWLRLRQVYTYSDFRFDDDVQYGDNRLPVVPEHVYRAELRVGTDRLHVAPSVEWVPEGPYADYNNTKQVDGYVLLGATASWSVNDRMDLFLDARNLGGEKAIGDVSAAITATDASAIYYPVERRAVFGGIRARF
ncbi:TonB-dependent receptor family protein [Hyphomonas chukchiensis]|nr:TonB-dependent receptor [Hyphomonas chukchiensis]